MAQPSLQPARTPEKNIAIILTVVVLVGVSIALALVMVVNRTPNVAGGEGGTTYGLRVTPRPDGWLIEITRGSENAEEVRLQVFDGKTNDLVYTCPLTWMGSSDGEFNDRNNNNRLDTGDTIFLKNNGEIFEGMRLELRMGNRVLGTIKELPEYPFEEALGIRAKKTAEGDWIINVTNGAKKSTEVTIKIIDPETGTVRMSTLLSTIPVANGRFNDNNNNLKINEGDSILLYSTAHGGIAEAGDRVEFLKGEELISQIKELPS